MSFLQYLSVLKARRSMILGILAAVVGLAVAVSLLMPKTYSATATVMVDVKSTDPVGNVALGTALQPETLQGYLTTQAEIIGSERTAAKVIKALDLEKDAELRERWAARSADRLTFEAWLYEHLRRKLEVRPMRDRSLIEITYSDPDRRTAANVANAFARAYLETDLEMKVDPARTSTAFFDERTKAVRTKLEQAQVKLSEYQRKWGILVSDEKFDTENTRLAELSTQLTAIEAAAGEADSKRRQGGSLSEVQLSPAVQNLRAELVKSEAKLRDVSSQYGPNHPLYQRTEAETRTLREAVAAETSRAAGTVGSSARVAREREAQIRAAYEVQRKRVLAMKEARDGASLLVRDLENANKEYEALLTRLGQTHLESQIKQTNVTILNRAMEPYYASSPKLVLNLVLAVFLGLVGGIGTAFALEVVDRRIRDANDLGETLRVPVLAVLEPEGSHRLAGGGGMLRLTGPSPKAAT
jgi:chain length determinant protein EpsF